MNGRQKSWAIAALVLVVLLLGTVTWQVMGRDSLDPRLNANGAYIYPSSAELEQLPEIEARIAACQVPAELLAVMGTEALLETALTYPYSNMLTAFSSYSWGVERVAQDSNAVVALLNRADAPSVMLNCYLDQGYRAWQEPTEAEASLAWWLEIYLAQPSIYEALTPLERRQLADYLAQAPEDYGVLFRRAYEEHI